MHYPRGLGVGGEGKSAIQFVQYSPPPPPTSLHLLGCFYASWYRLKRREFPALLITSHWDEQFLPPLGSYRKSGKSRMIDKSHLHHWQTRGRGKLILKVWLTFSPGGPWTPCFPRMPSGPWQDRQLVKKRSTINSWKNLLKLIYFRSQ